MKLFEDFIEKGNTVVIQELNHIKYIKVCDKHDANMLDSHFNKIGWKSKKYRKSLLDILNHYISIETNFPFLVEYNDDFGWIEIGSYYSSSNTLRQRRMMPTYPLIDLSKSKLRENDRPWINGDNQISKYQICEAIRLFKYLHEAELKEAKSKKYYILL